MVSVTWRDARLVLLDVSAAVSDGLPVVHRNVRGWNFPQEYNASEWFLIEILIKINKPLRNSISGAPSLSPKNRVFQRVWYSACCKNWIRFCCLLFFFLFFLFLPFSTDNSKKV